MEFALEERVTWMRKKPRNWVITRHRGESLPINNLLHFGVCKGYIGMERHGSGRVHDKIYILQNARGCWWGRLWNVHCLSEYKGCIVHTLHTKRVLLNRVTIKGNLRRCIDVENILWVLCKQAEKSISHLFCTCKVASKL